MNLLTRAAVSRLQSEGFLIFAPSDPTPLPIYDLPTAVAYVRAAGHAVVRSQPPKPPRPGDVWQPTRGRGRNGAYRTLTARWVRSVGTEWMSYATARDGMPVTIRLSTWERWRQQTRARVV